jgi:hypothetical protein
MSLLHYSLLRLIIALNVYRILLMFLRRPRKWPMGLPIVACQYMYCPCVCNAVFVCVAFAENKFLYLYYKLRHE